MSAKSAVLDSLDTKNIQLFVNGSSVYTGVMGTDFVWTDTNDKTMLEVVNQSFKTYICLSHIKTITRVDNN